MPQKESLAEVIISTLILDELLEQNVDDVGMILEVKINQKRSKTMSRPKEPKIKKRAKSIITFCILKLLLVTSIES